VGQRQLLCLSRALITKKKILVLDESTAHIDAATAAKLRRVMLKMRGKQTVMIIAHRLDDIAICDEVVVMDKGRIQEHGRPLDLLQDSNGAFSSLVNELDADSISKIRALALEASHFAD
jgi:ATP-binding cassette subfamily C (CFTR/MRP) protein 4